MTDVKYSTLDQEIIVLAAVWELIGSMVHYGHFVKYSDPEAMHFDRFTSPEARDIFLIILTDFLAYPRDGTFDLKKPTVTGGMQDTHLAYLHQIAENPQLGQNCIALKEAIEYFSIWLGGDALVEDVHLPSIEWTGTLRVKRKDYLKVCGNSTKHGFLRLNRNVKTVKRILSENGKVLDEGESYLVIPNFIEWFRNDVFVASATRVAWHLNEIRWGIYEYLRTEFQRSFQPTEMIGGAQMYRYNYPENLSDPLIKSVYWDLMNEVRSSPFVPRFTPNPYLFDLY
ncbi:hypothetical protein K3720_04820 [Leisingera caerulea]|uniref:hypothetical protein n=1 Tax=Leisingera caerulea TaxID=506591 RepID=UPI0021A79EC5|nr:hypothetical protein [Leisingera caerulea]UWQ50729.1 hypothetical protein K3720_04820 [Leisingera caerulea]